MQETQETWVLSLGQEDPLEKEITTHSIILGWKFPWREQSGSLWCPKESDTIEHTHTHTHTHKVSQVYVYIYSYKPLLYLRIIIPYEKLVIVQSYAV